MSNEQCLINALKANLRYAESEVKHLQADLKATVAEIGAEPRRKRVKAVRNHANSLPVFGPYEECLAGSMSPEDLEFYI